MLYLQWKRECQGLQRDPGDKWHQDLLALQELMSEPPDRQARPDPMWLGESSKCCRSGNNKWNQDSTGGRGTEGNPAVGMSLHQKKPGKTSWDKSQEGGVQGQQCYPGLPQWRRSHRGFSGEQLPYGDSVLSTEEWREVGKRKWEEPLLVILPSFLGQALREAQEPIV